MAAKSNTIVGLDIGTSQIKVVVAQVEKGKASHVTGVGTALSSGLRKGVVINIESTVQAITKAIEEADKMSATQISTVYASVSGSHIKGFNSHGVVGVRGREVSAYDIERVIEAARAVAIPADREVLHVLPQEFVIDGQDGIREPLGISGVRLEARVHVITGAIASAQNIVKCANRCGLTVKDIVLSPLAAGCAVLSNEEQELGVCIADIGGGTIDLMVYQGGAVQHSAVLPYGGSHITNDIAAGLRTPIAAAEDIKCQYASSNLRGVDPLDTIQVPSTGGRPARVVSRIALNEIVEPRVGELFSIIRHELEQSGCYGQMTGGVVLTGGSSSLPGIAEVGEAIMECPVRVGVPRGITGLTDLIGAPEYSTVAGLVLFASQAKSLSSFTHQSHGARKVMRSLRRWVGDHL